MTNFEKVGLFMSTFGQEVKKKSELSSEKINSLRLSLIQEELDELTKAINENGRVFPSLSFRHCDIPYLAKDVFPVPGGPSNPKQ